MKDPVGGKTPHVQDLLNAHEPLRRIAHLGS